MQIHQNLRSGSSGDSGGGIVKQYIVDAFTNKPFSGNPAAVCVMEGWPSDDSMMKLAMENNLSETAFVVKEPQGYRLRWFTPGDFPGLHSNLAEALRHLFFGAICLSIPRVAMTVRMLRSSIQVELAQNYVYTAKSRGLSRGKILLRHVLKNAMIPVVTFLAVSAAEIMTGTIIIEQVFTIPGTGRLLVSSIGNRDFPVVQAIIVILAAWIVIVNFAADMLNHWMDPRLRQ